MKNFIYFILMIPLGAMVSMAADLKIQEQELIDLAIRNNPEISAGNEMIEMHIKAAEINGSLPDPQLVTGYFFTPVETKVGPQEWKIGLSQMLPWFDKLDTKKQISLLQAEIARQNVRKAKLKVTREVRTVLQKLRLVAVDTDITRKNLGIFHQVESVIRSKYTTGSARQAHLIQLQVEILKLEDKLETLNEQKAKLFADLTDYTGDTGLPQLNFGDLTYFEESLFLVRDFEFLNNPDLQKINLQIEIAGKNLHQANLASYPDFMVGIDYVSLGGNASDNPMMGKLGITLPLWLGKNKAKREKAAAASQSVNFQLTDKIDHYTAMMENFKYKLEDTRRKYQLYNTELIPLAIQSYQTSEAAYLAEKLDFASYLEAERSLLNLQLAAAKARSDFYVTLANYLEINGSEY